MHTNKAECQQKHADNINYTPHFFNKLLLLSNPYISVNITQVRPVAALSIVYMIPFNWIFVALSTEWMTIVLLGLHSLYSTL